MTDCHAFDLSGITHYFGVVSFTTAIGRLLDSQFVFGIVTISVPVVSVVAMIKRGPFMGIMTFAAPGLLYTVLCIIIYNKIEMMIAYPLPKTRYICTNRALFSYSDWKYVFATHAKAFTIAAYMATLFYFMPSKIAFISQSLSRIVFV